MDDEPGTDGETAPATRNERYRRIIEVLATHGFAVAKDRIEHGALDERIAAVQLREALEELGTVFIKLGQFVSAQSASLPQAFRDELAKLDDDVPPAPIAAIRSTIEASLGSPTEELLASFDDHPLGSASIGQVHAATLHDGREVILKVKKPGVDELVATDLAIIKQVVGRLSPHWRLLRDMRADELMPEFVRTLESELDYAAEAASTRFFHAHFAEQSEIEVPGIVDALTRMDVICETRLDGVDLIAGATKLDATDRSRLVSRIVELVLEPGLTAGVFHADPHAGNLMVTTAGRLGVLDFGKAGHLSGADRRALSSLLLAIGARDGDGLAAALLGLALSSEPVEERRIADAADVLLQRYGDVAVSGIAFQQAMNDVLTLLRTNGLSLPGRIVLFFKALAMGEGLIRTIDPQARFTELLRPILRRIMMAQISGDDAALRLLSWASRSGPALAGLPVRLDRVLRGAADGNLRVWARVEDLPAAMVRLEGMVDRLSAAILVASAVIGIAVVMQVQRVPLPHGVGAVVWLLAGVMLSFVVRAMARRARRP